MKQGLIPKLTVIVLVLIICVAGLLYFFKPHRSRPAELHKSAVPTVSINISDQPTLGKPDAAMQIVAFEDLKCVGCRLFDTQLLPWVIEHYVDTGEATYTMMNVAFISGSMQAAVAARCIYQQNTPLFFDYVDLVYRHQESESTNWANTAKLLQWAHQIGGIDQDAFADCLLASTNVNAIIKNTQYGMDLMGGQLATPAVYINGILVRPLTQANFESIAKAARK